MMGSSHFSVEILHASPGRIRLRIPKQYLDDPTFLQAEQALTKLPGVSMVRKNPLTGSVVISFEPETVGFEDIFEVATAAGIIIEPSLGGQRADAEIRPLDQMITAFWQSVDDRIREGTRGSLDARTLLPIGLAALAVRELLATGFTAAPWYVLLWYSFDSFLKLRKPEASSNQR